MCSSKPTPRRSTIEPSAAFRRSAATPCLAYADLSRAALRLPHRDSRAGFRLDGMTNEIRVVPTAKGSSTSLPSVAS